MMYLISILLVFAKPEMISITKLFVYNVAEFRWLTAG